MADKRSPNSSSRPGASPKKSRSSSKDSNAESFSASDSSQGSNELDSLSRTAGLDRIRGLSHLLDNAIPIPGTGYSFGLDPILGLLPAGGDVMGTVLSAYIVLEAARFRLPGATLTRMVFNIVLEMVVGTVPLIGDLFDVGWKSNIQNLKLLEAHLEEPTEYRTADRKFLVILVLALVAVVAVQIVWYVTVFQWLVSWLGW
ncbi:MAG: DUF4112 domain-containing protein [Elainellaceae cyanobacterium]